MADSETPRRGSTTTGFDHALTRAEAEARGSAESANKTKARLDKLWPDRDRLLDLDARAKRISSSSESGPPKTSASGKTAPAGRRGRTPANMSTKQNSIDKFISKHSTTFRLAANTVSAVVVARAWDFWLSIEMWPVVLGQRAQEDTSEHPRVIQSVGVQMLMLLFTMVVGGVLATLTTKVWMRGPAGRMGAYSAGMLIGWQFISFTKAMHAQWVRPIVLHGGVFLLLPLADAIGVTVAAATVVSTAKLFLSGAKAKVTDTKAHRTNGDHTKTLLQPASPRPFFTKTLSASSAALVDESKKRALEVMSRTHALLDTVNTLLSNGLGLGVAALWDIVAEQMFRLDSYETFYGRLSRERTDVLPSPLMLTFLLALFLTSFCALLNKAIDNIKATQPEPPTVEQGDNGDSHDYKKDARLAAFRAYVEMRSVTLPLLSKILGFIVGWAWYDVARRVYPPYAKSISGLVLEAAAATLVSLVFLTLCGGQVPGAEKEACGRCGAEATAPKGAVEGVFLANAVGLVQGWSWCDAVDRVLSKSITRIRMLVVPVMAQHAWLRWIRPVVLLSALLPIGITIAVVWVRIAVSRIIAKRMWSRVRGARVVLKMLARQQRSAAQL